MENLLSWPHSGFHVHQGERIEADDRAGRERVAAYIRSTQYAEGGGRKNRSVITELWLVRQQEPYAVKMASLAAYRLLPSAYCIGPS